DRARGGGRGPGEGGGVRDRATPDGDRGRSQGHDGRRPGAHHDRLVGPVAGVRGGAVVRVAAVVGDPAVRPGGHRSERAGGVRAVAGDRGGRAADRGVAALAVHDALPICDRARGGGRGPGEGGGVRDRATP